ncbi:hypothetical protein [Nostoc sp. FACHB-145]|uniref:hypothetical protein n=1 Tax=Nostoc sp. FACHB-145 TaxID=2692836 RepID=UPI0016870F90|nr:hypothetical protein [Nostoc sp. FACHB-145]MBD2473013.1 hypothetical protein [Nostoc sp. FACHB-145]
MQGRIYQRFPQYLNNWWRRDGSNRTNRTDLTPDVCPIGGGGSRLGAINGVKLFGF